MVAPSLTVDTPTGTLANDRYRELLATNLRSLKGRTMFSVADVEDMLLDLWNALREDDERRELVPAGS